LNGIEAITLMRKRCKKADFILKGVTNNQIKAINKRKFGIAKTVRNDVEITSLVRKAISFHRIKLFKNFSLIVLFFGLVYFFLNRFSLI
jgi:hypothetical protein